VENNILEWTIRHSYGYGIDVSVTKPDYLTSVQCKTIQKTTTLSFQVGGMHIL
jgi:hypothetical protein